MKFIKLLNINPKYIHTYWVFFFKNKKYRTDITLLKSKNLDWTELTFPNYQTYALRNFLNFLTKNVNYSKKKTIKTRRKELFFFEKFLKLFFNHGLQIKFCAVLNKSVSFLYLYFYFFNKNTLIANPFYTRYLNSHTYSSFFFNFEKLLGIYFELLEQLFIFKITKVEKKYRKKAKKKFTGKYVYLKPQKRINFLFRNLINYSTLFGDYKLRVRLSNGLIQTLMEYKTSYLYEKKLATYVGLLKQSQRTNYS